jgi:hypothetical protein
VIAALLAGLLGCTARQAPETPETTPASAPRVLDQRLQLHLFAENPQIVTPIGIAVDSLDHLYVLESHTHLPPNDYPGPKGDVIKRFVDADGDGRPERVSVFAEGFQEGLALAFSPAGQLYVVTSRAVWRLTDRDGDGRSDEREKVLALTEPEKVYAHAALLGITFSADGWMYVSRGNTGSAAWKLVGTDNASLSGYGDGGNIVRARPDGSRLEEVATGFWNPVDLKFSRQGHLLTCDNDPDSRGPNRLVHVVPGGDYGYQSRYGGSGIHPYLAWNGELPGTLPYAAGLGEAPSGLLDASQAALPSDYAGQLLCSVWEESRIVRVKLSPRGASLAGTTQVIVEGDSAFRPVAFAAGRKGAVYFTDWVLRKYPNHGQGRIWKLTARPGVAPATPRSPYAAPLPDPAGEALRGVSAGGPYDGLQHALRSGDPFVRHAAVVALARPAYYPQLRQATGHPDPAVRLGAALALQRAGYAPAEPVIGRLLADPEGAVRQRALQWAGQSGLTSLRGQLDEALAAGPVTPALFETYLETVSHLEPAHAEAYRRRSAPYAKSIARPLPPRFIESFLADRSRPAPLRALALRHLAHPGEHQALLFALLAERDPGLRLQTVRTLADLPGEGVAGRLLDLALDASSPVPLRAEALLGLSRQPPVAAARVIPLLDDPAPDVQLEAARYLRNHTGSEAVKQALRQRYAALREGEAEPLHQQIALALAGEPAGKPFPPRPASRRAWETALATGGDPARGYRVFYSVPATCAACHAVAGRGGDLGPDLTNVGRSKSRGQLVQAILAPSAEISPEYQGWYIRQKDGQVHQGRQIDVGEGAIDLLTPGAGFIKVARDEVADYGMVEESLMPGGLEAGLTVEDLRDLLAFLAARPGAAENGKQFVRTAQPAPGHR